MDAAQRKRRGVYRHYNVDLRAKNGVATLPKTATRLLEATLGWQVPESTVRGMKENAKFKSV